jgi:hypothetical protein
MGEEDIGQRVGGGVEPGRQTVTEGPGELHALALREHAKPQPGALMCRLIEGSSSQGWYGRPARRRNR